MCFFIRIIRSDKVKQLICVSSATDNKNPGSVAALGTHLKNFP